MASHNLTALGGRCCQRRSQPLRSERQRAGDAAEAAARRALEAAGLVCLGMQLRYPVGELDLVMREASTLVFVEVRLRRRTDFGGALQSLTPAKLRRVARAAQVFLLRHPAWQKTTCRFDVVALDGDGRIDWQRSAFTLDDLR